jgi:putative PIN family toxin of toxin-antitoxin system
MIVQHRTLAHDTLEQVNASSSRLVLDTNVVLDCFVFHNPVASDLTSALERGSVLALVHQYTIDELRRVLSYAQCRLSEVQQGQILERYLSKAIRPPLPEHFSSSSLMLPANFPRCRDPDDQPYLALAYHARADALVTKDKALLKLRKKAKKFGVSILPPQDIR